MTKNKEGNVVILLIIFVVGGFMVTSALNYYQSNDQSSNEVIFFVPLGVNGIHYAGDDNPDVLRWGPSTVTVAPDGTFWIADTPADYILQYNTEGESLAKIAIEDWVVGAGDLVITDKDIWILDIASIPPKLVRLTLDGKYLDSLSLPKGLYLEDGLTGFAISNDGNIIIEREGGLYLAELIVSSENIQINQLEGYEFQGGIVSVYPANIRDSSTRSFGYIMIGDHKVIIEVEQVLGSLSIAKIDADGTLFVDVAELVFDSTIKVDQKIYRYDPFGNLIGMARVPLSEQYIPVAHNVAIAPNNDVYVLVTKPDGVEVQRLIFRTSLSSILSTPAEVEPFNLPGSTQLECLYRSSMINIADDYLNNSIYINSYHINVENENCTTREKPSYLTTANTYDSVPYDWGGWDSVQEFNNYMSINLNEKFAGDINTSEEGCSRGVDCSGLVSNAWDLDDHFGTCTLETISTALNSTADLQPGDIMNRCDITPRHTIIFHAFGNYGQGQGMYGYEATTENNYDRVVRVFRLFDDIESTYIPRRYNNVCPNKVHLPFIVRSIPIMTNLANPYPGPGPKPYPPPHYPYP